MLYGYLHTIGQKMTVLAVKPVGMVPIGIRKKLPTMEPLKLLVSFREISSNGLNPTLNYSKGREYCIEVASGQRYFTSHCFDGMAIESNNMFLVDYVGFMNPQKLFVR